MTKNKHASLELKTNKQTNKQTGALASTLAALRRNSALPHARFCLSVFFSLFLYPLFFFFPSLPSDGSSVSGILESTWTPSVSNPAHRGGKTDRPGGCRRASPNCDQMFPPRAARERRAAPNIFRHIRVPGWLAGWPSFARSAADRAGRTRCCCCCCCADSSDSTPRLVTSPHSGCGRTLRSARRAGITAADDVHLLPPTWTCEVRRPSG